MNTGLKVIKILGYVNALVQVHILDCIEYFNTVF